MKNLIRNRYFKIALLTFLTYTFAGFLLIPFLIQHYLPDIVRKSLGTHATLYKASFNPYTFELKLDNLVLQDQDARRLASFNTLQVDFDVNDLLSGQLLFKRIYLQHLKLDVRVDNNGRYNFQHILDHLASHKTPPDEEKPSGEMIGVRIHELHIDDARVLFEDNSLSEPFTVKTKPFDFQLKDFSTVLNEEGKLHFMIATYETGSIQSTATISLQPFSIKGNFEVDDFNINKLYSYIKDNVAFTLEGNKLNAAFDYRLAYGNGELRFDMTGSKINIDRLHYSDANQSAAFKSLSSSINAIRLRSSETSFETALDTFDFNVMDLNYTNETLQASLGAFASRLAAIDLQKNGDAPMAMILQEYGLEIEGVHYSDVAGKTADLSALETGFKQSSLVLDDPFSGDVENIYLNIQESAYRDPQIEAKLDAFDHTLVKFTIHRNQGDLTMRFDDVNNTLQTLYYRDSRNIATLGRIGLDLASVDIDSQFNVAAALRTLDLNTLHLTNRQRDILRMKGIAVQDVVIDTGGNEYNITKVSLNGADANVRLYADMKSDLDYLLPESPQKKAAAQPASQQAIETVPRVQIKDIWLNNSRLTFRDLRKEPVVLSVKHINTHISNATLDEKRVIPFSFSNTMPGEGAVRGWGSFRAKPLDVKLDLQSKRIDLRPYTPYVKAFVNLDINSSYLSNRFALRMKQKKEMDVTLKGEMTFTDVDLAHATKREKLFGVKEIKIEGIDYAQNHLKINDIIIDTPYNKVAIDENKSTNFDGLIVTASPENGAVTREPDYNKEANTTLTYMLGELIVKNGTLDFSDFSLPLKFKTRVDNLEGAVVAISSSLEETTRVKLDGVVDEYGSANIGGTLIAADPTRQTDIKIDFKNIDVTSLSPYTGKFIGRTIQSGKLWLDLGYKIDNKALLSSNKIKIKDLELGEEIESDDAVNLPVGLAIALLKDSNGYIDVSVPVEGNVDDPDFKYGAAAFKAIGNLIVGIAAAPFKFLGSALGIDAEAMAKMEFDFGSSELHPSEKEKLDKLTDVFVQRPEISLVITPTYMLDRDRSGLQKKKFYALAVNEFKESDERNTKYSFVKQLYIQTFGEEKYDTEYDALKASLKEGDDIKSLFFDIQLQALIEAQPVTQNELETLAMERCLAIKGHLLGKGFDLNRIRIEEKTVAQKASDVSVMTMDLGVDVKQ